MTDLTAQFDDGDVETSAEVIVRTALAAAEPRVIADRETVVFRTFDGDVKTVTGPEPRLSPDRKTGRVRLYDATSFAAYFHKHHENDQAEIYADPYAPTIVAVLNGLGLRGDTDVDPELGWGDHRAELIFRTTLAWQRWTKRNGVLGTQSEFAEHIEESLPDIIEPDGATMLELAQSFQAHSRVHFESAKDLGSGQRQLVYREQTDATAGVKGDITIPKEFVVALSPYEGSSLYRVTARLRYRLTDGRLSIGYVLDRPEDVLRNAFDDVLKQVQDETGRTALLGIAP